MIIKFIKDICLQLLSRLVYFLMEMGIEDHNKRNEDTYDADKNSDALEEGESNVDLCHTDVVKPLLLLKGPSDVDIQQLNLMNLRLDGYESVQKDQEQLTASTSTIFGSSSSIESQRLSRSSESEEDILYKSPAELQKQCLEDERKWLKYRVDSVTREQAIIFCVIGQMLFTSEEVAGSRQEVPTPEDAKQILLVMTYGDHWILKKLAQIMAHFDKVNNLIAFWGGVLDYSTTSRRTLESLIARQMDFSRREYF